MMFTAENIRKRYGRHVVLDGLTLAAAEGAALAVAGKNGCGKSTLLAIMAGALKPSGGTAALDGRDVSRDRTARRRVGYLPQDDPLFEELTVADNLRFWAGAQRVRLGRVKENPAVRLLDLGDVARKPARKLSGGTRRRVSICARLIADPAALLLDEPFAGLDLYCKQELIGYLKKLKAMGKTIVYTSHGADEILPLADSLIIIAGGLAARRMDAAAIQACGAGLTGTITSVMMGEA